MIAVIAKQSRRLPGWPTQGLLAMTYFFLSKERNYARCINKSHFRLCHHRR